ncbi:MAG: hypothetical protein K6A40_01485 [Solobacterium sp.]|nr:hypothetical protein [Solobacterium sp.]
MKAKKLLTTLLTAVLLAGCSGSGTPASTPDPYAGLKEYSYKNVKLYLPEDQKFSDMKAEGFEYAVTSDKLIVFMVSEKRSDFAAAGKENITMEEYVEVCTKDSENLEVKKIRDDFYRAEYTYTSGDNHFFYVTGLFEKDDTFWIINLASLESNREELLPKMEELIEKVIIE